MNSTTLSVFSVGGAGFEALRRLNRIRRRRKIPNLYLAAFDTDEGTQALAADEDIPFQLVSARGPNAKYGDNRLETARRFPNRFSPLVRKWFQAFGDEEVDIVATDEGSGTRPFIGSIKFLLAEDEVKAFLRQQLHAALKKSQKLEPLVIGSAGGGTSAAGCPYLSDLLGNDEKRARLTPEAYRIGKPSLLCMPPLIQANMQDTPTFGLRPLANAYAAMWEANYLSWNRSILQQYVLHTCNAEQAVASTLDDASEFMAEVLAAQALGLSHLRSIGNNVKNIVRVDLTRHFAGYDPPVDRT